MVQKYIERPLLVKQKKFDIRQWVLVMSWEPLDVYVFSGCYLKICGNEYNLRSLSDPLSHLSNFSIQKGRLPADELTMSHEQFEEHLKATRADFSWDKELRPRIHAAVWGALKGAAEAMEQRANTFEVYGFDLVLDERLRPWVIEVNLSPACHERAAWLTQMVDDMSLDLLAHLHQRVLADAEGAPATLPPPLSLHLNPDSFYHHHQLKHRWIRLKRSL